MRTAEIKRKTKETDIEVFVKLDGEGKVSVNTGIGFFVLFVNFTFPLSENETLLCRPAYKEQQHFNKYLADIFIVYQISDAQFKQYCICGEYAACQQKIFCGGLCNALLIFKDKLLVHGKIETGAYHSCTDV